MTKSIQNKNTLFLYKKPIPRYKFMHDIGSNFIILLKVLLDIIYLNLLSILILRDYTGGNLYILALVKHL